MRGKNIWKSILMLAIVLTTPIALVITPTFAAYIPPYKAILPTVVDPNKAPGTILSTFLLAQNFELCTGFSVNIAFNPAVIQAQSFTAIGASPMYFTIDQSKPFGFDNVAGKLWCTIKRYMPGAFTDLGPIAVLSIKFLVVSRAESPIDIVNMNMTGGDTLLEGPVQPDGRALILFKSFEKYADNVQFNNWFNAGEPIYNDTDTSGDLTAGDVLIQGSAILPTLRNPGAQDKYYDADLSGTWDIGEPAIRDVDSSGNYTTGDVVLGGSAPAIGSTLSNPGLLDKYFDQNFNKAWDVAEPAIRDADASGDYTVGDVILVPADAKVPPYGAKFVAFSSSLKHTENIAVNGRFNAGEAIYAYDITNSVQHYGLWDPVKVDGYFNNNWQGKLIASDYINEGAMPPETFSIDISVAEVTKLWGYQMIIDFDPDVLTCLMWTNLAPFTIKGQWEINNEIGYIAISANSYYGDPTGLTTTDPVPVATILFAIDQKGWSKLDIHNEKLANVYGDAQTLEVFDGAFSCFTAIADLKGRMAWPETHVFKVSQQPTSIDMVYARIATNATGTPVTVWAHFTVYDRDLAVYLGEFDTNKAVIPELSSTVVAGEFDTSLYEAPYKVMLVAQAYCDINGDGVADSTGIIMKYVPITVKQ